MTLSQLKLKLGARHVSDFRGNGTPQQGPSSYDFCPGSPFNPR